MICVDLRGRGDSAYAKDAMSYVPLTYVQDMEALLRAETIDRFVAFGTSLGGLITMLLASTRPGRVIGALLNDVGPHIEPAGLGRIRDYVGQGRSFPTWMHAAWALSEVQGDIFPGNAISDWLDMAKKAMKVGAGGRIVYDYDMKIAEPFAVPGGEAGVDLWPTLAGLAPVPVLIVRGALSDLFSVDTAQRMLGVLPHAELLTVPGKGHAPTLEEPEVAQAITRCSPKWMPPRLRPAPKPHKAPPAMTSLGKPARILHLHSTFDLGGKEARAVRLMNYFGGAAHHTILTAVPDALGARTAINPGIRADFPTDAPSLAGKPSIARYREFVAYFKNFDLILSYNWGAMDGVMARTLFAGQTPLPPVIHHEDGFNEDEAVRLKRKRNWFRMVALARTEALVVPSYTLERIAFDVWKQPDNARAPHRQRHRCRRLCQAPPARRDARLPAPRWRDRHRHARRPARGQEPAPPGPRRRRARYAGAAGDRGRGAGARGDRGRSRARRPERPPADAGLPQEPRALHRPVRHFRFVVGQRAAADLGDRSDGSRASGSSTHGRRRRAHGRARTTRSCSPNPATRQA